MSQDITLKFRINLPILIALVAIVHLFLFFVTLPKISPKVAQNKTSHVGTPFKIRDLRTVGAREAKRKDSVYAFKGKEAQEVAKSAPEVRENLSLKDLAEQVSVAKAEKAPQPQKTQKSSQTTPLRPGKKPEQQKTALEAIKLRGDQMRNYANNQPVREAFRGDPRAAGLNTSDISVNLEVPEGVSPDELNKYELMFYGFQRRTAINYINSFYKNLEKFRQANPHLQFPMTQDMQVMTGRLTYDEKGNIKKIKMVQWSNIDKLQNFFVDVLKDMDTLHNPPQALWEETGEFSIYFSLIVNG